MTRFLLVCACAGFVLTGCDGASDSASREKLPTVDTTGGTAATSTAPVATTPAGGTTAGPIDSGNDVTGGYFALDALPAEFSEIDHMLLATIDENAQPSPLNGFIRPKSKSASDYVLVSPTLDGKNLTFTTVAVKGVTYSFTGAFQTVGNFPANPPAHATPVLTGTLTKMKNGAMVAETPVRFEYSAGD